MQAIPFWPTATGSALHVLADAIEDLPMASETESDCDVLVLGGGNAALCAALSALEHGARKVVMLEAAPTELRGGNSSHTRNLRCMHDVPTDVLTDAYPEQEYWQDLLQVTGGQTNEALARLTIRESAHCRDWMRGHGVRFQPSLTGTLHLSRTNAFFLGGGKALVNAYYRAARQAGIDIRFGASVQRLVLDGARVQRVEGRDARGDWQIRPKAVVAATGGFQANDDWMREAWGPAADNFLIRGTAFNRGTVLASLRAAGLATIGDPTQCHAVAIDARAPRFDGGIITRVDSVSLGIVVNRRGERFYDEGEDFWPKRYAIWGRLVAGQPGQRAYSIIDSQAMGRFMPPVFPPTKADSLAELATALDLEPQALLATVADFNAAIRPGQFDHTRLDDCRTEGLEPPKSHWAMPITQAPFYAYPLAPGITFTYLGLAVDAQARCRMQDGTGCDNLFAAGEIMAGNVLGKGYLAGIGMTIGTVFGRIAGREAARAAGMPSPARAAIAPR